MLSRILIKKYPNDQDIFGDFGLLMQMEGCREIYEYMFHNEKTQSESSFITKIFSQANLKIERDTFHYEQEMAQQSYQSQDIVEPAIDQVQSNSDPTSLQSKRLNYEHTKGKRINKKYQSLAKQSMHGYWSNNLPQFAQTSHVNFFLYLYGQEFFVLHPQLQTFRQEYPTKKRFLDVYKVQKLRPYFLQYFRKKILQRDLKNGRSQPKTKQAYADSLHVFKDAFKDGLFPSFNGKRSQDQLQKAITELPIALLSK